MWTGTIHYSVYIVIYCIAGIGTAICIIDTYVDWSYTLYCTYLDMFFLQALVSLSASLPLMWAGTIIPSSPGPCSTSSRP